MSPSSNFPPVSRWKMWRSKRICGRLSAIKPHPDVSTVSTVQRAGASTETPCADAFKPAALNARDFPAKVFNVSLISNSPYPTQQYHDSAAEFDLCSGNVLIRH